MSIKGEVVAKHEMGSGHDTHDGDGMAHHRKAQHAEFERHTADMKKIPGVMDTDAAGPPDGAPHNPQLYTSYGEDPHHGVAGENMPMGAYSRDGGEGMSTNLPGGSPC